MTRVALSFQPVENTAALLQWYVGAITVIARDEKETRVFLVIFTKNAELGKWSE